jgi:hypothetical protein
MSEQVLYRAKAACRIGGAFRRAGEVFTLPKFETVPHFLEEVAASVPASTTEPGAGYAGGEAGGRPPRRPSRRASDAPGPMPSDFPGVVRD